MTDTRMPGEDEVYDAEVVEGEVVDGEVLDDSAEDDSADDAINTESANDGEEVAPAAAGATAPAAERPAPSASGGEGGEGGDHPDSVLAAQRLEDLQRLNAEYVNYKRRVDRDRAAVQERAVRDVLDSLLPVLDDIQLARDHGDLTDGPFAAIADKLESSLGKFGLTRFGSVGEVFDPTQHEALMHAAWDASNPELPTDADSTTVVQVLQPGYRSGDQVLRPARVAVADPE